MTSSVVLTREHGGVAVIALNEPERRNVLSPEIVAGIDRAFTEAESDSGITCVVLTGRGPAFCAGADLSTLEASADGEFGSVRSVYEGFLRVLRSPLPTIAAVDGAAVGAGMNLALACDVRLASPAAHFDSRFARLRLHPGGGHTWLLERAVGAQRAMLAVLFGQTWSADEALRHGLVASVDADVLSVAVDLGAGLGGYDQEFVKRLVGTLRTASETPRHADVIGIETEAQAWSVKQPEFVANVRRLRGEISSR